MFVGIQSPGCTSAKHVVFQQPLPTAMKSTSLVHHEIFFRAEGDPTLKKIEPDHCDELILHSMPTDIAETTPAASTPVSLHEQSSIAASESKQQQNMDQQADHMQRSVIGSQPQSALHEQSSIAVSESKQQQNMDQQADDDMQTSEQKVIESQSQSATPDLEVPSEESKKEQFILECANADAFINSMSHYKNKGKIEFYHAFDCGSHMYKMREILKIFINDLTLCILVVDGSQNLEQIKGFDVLHENKVFALKELIIGTHSDLKTSPEAMNASFQQFSDSLIMNHPKGFIFPMNSKEPNNTDYECGSDIINLSLSLASPKRFPFSWYLFGFKLQRIMMSLDRKTLSISKECMIIAEELKMDRPTVEAALEHLTEHNIILYFRDILNDIVFLSVNVFSAIFSKLYSRRSVQYSAIIDQPDLYQVVAGDEIVSADLFIHLFKKLMILTPYDDSSSKFIMPCLLPLLNQSKVDEIHTAKSPPLMIKCPSTGFEYICLLTAFLLALKWTILNASGKPMCLYKNAVKYYVENLHGEITITFSRGYLKVSASEGASLSGICTTILKGLENIRFTLRCHKNFDFKVAFLCDCGRLGEEHSSTYNSETMTMTCDVNQTSVPLLYSQKSNITEWFDDSTITGKIVLNHSLYNV